MVGFHSLSMSRLVLSMGTRSRWVGVISAVICGAGVITRPVGDFVCAAICLRRIALLSRPDFPVGMGLRSPPHPDGGRLRRRDLDPRRSWAVGYPGRRRRRHRRRRGDVHPCSQPGAGGDPCFFRHGFPQQRGPPQCATCASSAKRAARSTFCACRASSFLAPPIICSIPFVCGLTIRRCRR